MNDVAGIGAGNVSGIGDTPRRREDVRFLRGQGRYLDDIAFPGAAHAIFLRASHAHAILHGLDTKAARAMPGVLAILTAQDAARTGCGRCARRSRPMSRPTSRSASCRSRCWRRDTVRYAGEPVALIVAETRNQALDAAERIDRRLTTAAGGHHGRARRSSPMRRC